MDLPDPVGPRMATVWPFSTVKAMSSTARRLWRDPENSKKPLSEQLFATSDTKRQRFVVTGQCALGPLVHGEERFGIVSPVAATGQHDVVATLFPCIGEFAAQVPHRRMVKGHGLDQSLNQQAKLIQASKMRQLMSNDRFDLCGRHTV